MPQRAADPFVARETGRRPARFRGLPARNQLRPNQLVVAHRHVEDDIVTVGADCTTDAWPQERSDSVVAFASPRPGLLISDGTVVEHRAAPHGPSTFLGRIAAGSVDDVLAEAPGADDAEVMAGGPGLQTYGKEMGGALYWWTMDPTLGGTATLMIRDADGERALRVERVEGTFRNQGRPPPDAAGFDCAAWWCAVCLTRSGAAEVTWFDPRSGADQAGPFRLPGEGCAIGPDGSVWTTDGPGNLVRRMTAGGEVEVVPLRGVIPQYVQPTPLGLLASGRSGTGWAAGWHGADGRFVPVVEADDWRSLPHLDPTQTRLAWLQATVTGDAWRLRPR